jgi:hypothetical protein
MNKKEITKTSQIQILEVNTHKGKLGFKPWRREKDPLLKGKNKRSLRLFVPLNLANHEIHDGDLWVVQVMRSEILPRVSVEKRVIIRNKVLLVSKQRGLAYISHKTDELVQKVFSPDNDIDELEKYELIPI